MVAARKIRSGAGTLHLAPLFNELLVIERSCTRGELFDVSPCLAIFEGIVEVTRRKFEDSGWIIEMP